MPPRRQHAHERRRDRRIPVAARVRIEPRVGAGVVQAELVDVSSGGLRASCPLPQTLELGSPVDVEITVIEIQGDRVRLGIDAPKQLPVHRDEVWLRIQAEEATQKERADGEEKVGK